ncbi:MAG: hypothetical protein E7622_05765, partial [Ruminococcaceae bacterium]|nr:hypothetical protein [Oscillospiraceae bacterium]
SVFVLSYLTNFLLCSIFKDLSPTLSQSALLLYHAFLPLSRLFLKNFKLFLVFIYNYIKESLF